MGSLKEYPKLVAEQNIDGNDVRWRVGICASCEYSRRVESDRGSAFYLCGRSVSDSNFPKYPRLPVLECPGFAEA